MKNRELVKNLINKNITSVDNFKRRLNIVEERRGTKRLVKRNDKLAKRHLNMKNMEDRLRDKDI